MLALMVAPALVPAFAKDADLNLNGSFTAADNETYTEVPFDVPAGVTRLTIRFDSEAMARGASINLAVRAPDRLRGWSGEIRPQVTIGETDSTPGYLTGPIVPGRWSLLVGAGRMPRDPPVHYSAQIWFDHPGDAFRGFSVHPVKSGPGWYRGDLHMHSGHSDGECKSMRGVDVPCPVFPTLAAARDAHLDFISLTDHNTTSQTESLRELAPYFDDLLIIPGQEVSMFRGHANVFGPTQTLDFNVGGARGPGFNHLLDEVEQVHGVISINHPGADCCRWRMQDVDYRRVNALEVINGGNLDDTGSPEGRSSFPLWEELLNEGYRIAGISGSDNHEAFQRIARDNQGIGRPTVVVYATELSQSAVLDAIRSGHAFIDVWGAADRFLEVDATSGPASGAAAGAGAPAGTSAPAAASAPVSRTGAIAALAATAGTLHAMMGDTLKAPRGAPVTFAVHVRGAPEGSRISIAGNGASLVARADTNLPVGETRRSFQLKADGRAHWVRFDVRDAKGVLLLVGNPIYLRGPIDSGRP